MLWGVEASTLPGRQRLRQVIRDLDRALLKHRKARRGDVVVLRCAVPKVGRGLLWDLARYHVRFKGYPEFDSLLAGETAESVCEAWGSWVTRCGRICIGKRKINFSTVFAGQLVGVRQVTNSVWLVSFMHYDLGYFDHETCRLEPRKNPFEAKVLPMSPV